MHQESIQVNLKTVSPEKTEFRLLRGRWHKTNVSWNSRGPSWEQKWSFLAMFFALVWTQTAPATWNFKLYGIFGCWAAQGWRRRRDFKCALRHSSVNFSMLYVAKCLRIRRFNERTCRPPRGKTLKNYPRFVYLFHRPHFFFGSRLMLFPVVLSLFHSCTSILAEN